MASINKRVAKNGEVSYQLVFELGVDPVTGKRQRIFKTVKGTKKQALAVMDKMKVEVMSLYSQVSDLQKYVKYMPPEVKQQYKEARENAMRMLRGEYDR